MRQPDTQSVLKRVHYAEFKTLPKALQEIKDRLTNHREQKPAYSKEKQ